MNYLEANTIINIAISFMVFFTCGLLVLAFLGGHDVKNTGLLDGRLRKMGFQRIESKERDENDETRAQEAIQRALDELEAIRKRQGRSRILQLLKSSGTGRTVRGHFMISIGTTVIILVVLNILSFDLWFASLISVAAGWWLPLLHLKILTSRRMALFSDDLPEALDLIVRGIRAGLPLLECFKLAASEWRDPLKSEFLQMINDMGVGLSIRDAVARFAERVPLQETKLLAIVIAIQSQSGGNLSEVLTGLADLLRERAKLYAKMRAMSSEARTSAWIIGSIPVLLVGAVSILSPGFLDPLFETQAGHIVIGACIAWMAIGMLVMKAMMKIDF